MAPVRRADARAFLFFLDVGLARRHAMHRQRQPARRGEGLGALVDEAGRHQPVGDDLLQILGGARLHARGDFLGQEFKQEVGHGGQGVKTKVSRRRLPSKAAGRCHPRRRPPTSRPRRHRRHRRPSRRRRRKNPDEPDETGTALAKALLTLDTEDDTALLKSPPDQPPPLLQAGW